MTESPMLQEMLPQQSSCGRVRDILLIETEGTYDLPYFLQWLRLMRVRRGILLMVDVVHCSEDARAILHDIASLGIDIITVSFLEPAARDRALLDTRPRNSFALPAADLMLTLSHIPSGKRTLYIGKHSRHPYSILQSDQHFRAAARRLGIGTLACRDDGLPALEGGDCLRVGRHLFIGRRTEESFGPDAERSLRQAYGLSDDLCIHFAGVADPSPASGLYHLDLYFTYAGLSAQGRHQFLTGYIDEQSIGDIMIGSMRDQLVHFAVQIRGTLDDCYGDNYDLTPVPIICCDIYRVSPLNGIIDYIDGIPTYYFPWPEFVNYIGHPDFDTRRRITDAVQRAYDIIAARMGGEQHVVRLSVPIGYTTGSGQALHCTLAVIGRDSE